MAAGPGSTDWISEINRRYAASQKGLSDSEKSTQLEIHKTYGHQDEYLRNLYLLTRRDHAKNVEMERNNHNQDPRPLEDRLEPSYRNYAQAADLLGLGGADIMYDEGSESMGRPNVSQRIRNANKGHGYVTDADVPGGWRTAQRETNAAAGLGPMTHAEVERERNAAAGFGPITDSEVERQRAANAAAGRGEITHAEADAQRATNAAAGHGSITDAEVEKETNAAAGRGPITHVEVEAQRAANATAGRGRITDTEVDTQRAANAAAGRGMITHQEGRVQIATNADRGHGPITDAEVEAQRAANATTGFGRVTDAEVGTQRAANAAAGRGRITDVEVEAQREANAAAGYGKKTNAEIGRVTSASPEDKRMSTRKGKTLMVRAKRTYGVPPTEAGEDLGGMSTEEELPQNKKQASPPWYVRAFSVLSPAAPWDNPPAKKTPPPTKKTPPSYEGFGGGRKTRRSRVQKAKRTRYRKKREARQRKSTRGNSVRRKRPQTRKRR